MASSLRRRVTSISSRGLIPSLALDEGRGSRRITPHLCEPQGLALVREASFRHAHTPFSRQRLLLRHRHALGVNVFGPEATVQRKQPTLPAVPVRQRRLVDFT